MSEKDVLDELFNDDEDENMEKGKSIEDEIFGSDSEDEAEAANESKGRRKPKPKQPRKKRDNLKQKSQESVDEEPQIDEKILEARRDFDEALSAIKGGRRRKADDDSEAVNLDETAIEFTNKMLAAVKKDDEAVMADKPAIAKLQMMNEVIEMLTKKNMQDVLLDNQVLDCIKKWLEPNIKGHLPAASLRKQLLELLKSLPIETIHLRESGIGKIVMYFYQRKRETMEIKKMAGELISVWSRPIIGHSLDYRELAKRAQSSASNGADDGDFDEQPKNSKVLQSDSFRKMARSGALDRDGSDSRYKKLSSTLLRKKSTTGPKYF